VLAAKESRKAMVHAVSCAVRVARRRPECRLLSACDRRIVAPVQNLSAAFFLDMMLPRDARGREEVEPEKE
jgi:hypothetical protein